MKTILKMEEVAMFAFALLLWHQAELTGWLFWALILAPDIGMLGYLINPKIGGALYNLFHHKAVGLMLYYLGLVLHNDAILGAGLIVFGHASMDRVFGYGLKYFSSFHDTHLGKIGKEA